MAGNAVFRLLSDDERMDVIGAVRSANSFGRLVGNGRYRVNSGVDVENSDHLISLFADYRPTHVINCVGVVKQLDQAKEPLVAIPINSLLPHRLALMGASMGFRLIHLSTDCVFSGARGMYAEHDYPDASDLYGRSKLLGEVDYPNAVTIRTSILGHELGSARSLVGWFLSQEGEVRGFTQAIFSGIPTVELARVIRDFVIPSPALRGVHHVSSSPISKFDLLKLVAAQYRKEIVIVPDGSVRVNRSLDSSRFRAATGYAPPSWVELVRAMHSFG
jgi:dTDP-4-dehydrorhamnose reductase